MSDITPIKTLVTIETLNIASASNNSGQTPNPLSTVANGTFVDGFVVNRTPQNLPVLRTPMGDVLINTPLFMKTGTEVTIRVDHSQPHLARIISIDGKSPEVFAEIQENQRAQGSRDSLQSQMASAVNTQSSTPKPVNLQGIILQLVTRDTLPSNIADSLFRALGLDKTQRAGLPQNTQPLSLVLKSITMPSPTSAMQAMPQIHASVSTPTATAPVPPSGTTSATSVNNTLQSAEEIASTTLKPEVTIARPPQSQAMTQPATQNASSSLPQTASQASTQSTSQPSAATASQLPISNALLKDTGTTQPPPSPNQTPSTRNHSAPDNTIKQPITPPSPSVSSVTQQPINSANPQASSQSLPQQQQAQQVRQLSVEITPQKTVAMQALVIGHEQSGDTIVHSPIGSMRIFTQKPLPQGTVMMLEVIPQAADANKPSAPQPFLQNIAQEIESQALKDWPALSSLSEELARQDATMLQQFMAANVPSPGKHLTQTMLFFLAALKGGDIKQWIGQKSLDAMEQKYGDTLKRLGAEFAALQPLFADPAPQQQWISASIPVYVDQKLEHIKLYVKQDETKDSIRNTANGQRFIIDIELSQLGAMQFDGFVHKESSRKQFDLMVRTAQTLAPATEQDIRTIFIQSLEAMGFTGSILFQPSRDKFISIPNHHIAKDLGGIIA